MAAGAVPLIEAALRSHPSKAELQYYGCPLLTKLKAYDGKGALKSTTASTQDQFNQFVESGDCGAVVAAMRADAGEARVQEWGCQAVRVMSYRGDADTDKRIAAAGGIEVVVAALKRFGAEDIEVVKQACMALQNVCTGNADNKKAIASAGGVEAVVSALRAHGGAHAEVAEEGCGALRGGGDSGGPLRPPLGALEPVRGLSRLAALLPARPQPRGLAAPARVARWSLGPGDGRRR